MPQAILFTDWDGTVTLQDSNDMLTDNLGMGHPARMVLNDKLIEGTLNFRDAFYDMLASVSDNGHSLDKCIGYLLEHVQLDPGFKETVVWCHENDIPVVVVSSGMDRVIRALLKNLIEDEKLQNSIQIYSNSVETDGDEWRIIYKDHSSFGHDKHQSIEHATAKAGDVPSGKRFYCGDGVSDVSAARSCDLLFAKSGKDLVNICRRDNINYIEFNSFQDILAHIKKVVST
ncbi:uncharacterized protein C5L36_0A12050 [Pichia kudriavzevii]|uniref:Pdp3-interacting factor 1 n=1 Tax=Pichia kudriavzevii TaxID=4909 RepID=A0A1V2LH31_PICKU|nr:uncharacterized protein C5L36_0A12050 [Pichia kudriavzevii]AWU74627.1 hypothetical protein C5L36_0A12050 [Pichia kudriavzevii]ONH70807.1 Pdp3-interacting factor 1 [Pichia kudriavzevii]